MKKNARILIRVTSEGYETEDSHIFRGVAVDGDGDNLSGTKFYIIKVLDRLKPAMPARGQLWKVTVESTTSREVIRNETRLTEVFITVQKARVIIPESENLFTRYIATDPVFVGIGERIAMRLWVKFQKRIFELLENKDIEQLKQASFVNDQIARSLIEGWHQYENLKHIGWFEKHDIPSGIARDMIKNHKNNSIKAIEDDPYRLISFGLKFSKVDYLARTAFGIEHTSYLRYRGAIEQALLMRMVDGHTVSKYDDLMPVVSTLLGNQELALEAFKSGYDNSAFIVSENGHYHSIGQWIMEQVVASRFAELSMRKVWSSHYDKAFETALTSLAFSLEDKQKEAVKSALTHAVSVISGGAGTGKTTVLNVVLRAYKLLGTDIRSMALSGRAAKRITEATGFPARTIAGFLNSLKDEPLGKRALIVIDEASMVDLATMFKLITVAKSQVRFLLVGDPKQLAPITAGLVLHDVVNIIPSVTLDIVKRQKGSTGIPEFTKLVVEKQVPEKAMYNNNIVFHECLQKDINERVMQLYQQQSNNTQIISAKYAGNGGVDIINELCQSSCNGEGKILRFEVEGAKHYLPMRENDPVIFTENNWDKGVQNGTLGRLLNVGSPTVDVEDDDGGISFADVEIDTGELIPLTIDLMDSIRVAYAISLHKAQGSQFKRVIIPIINSDMLDNAWIYTALTRAEVKIELVGRYDDFVKVILRESESDKRDTYLSELLQMSLEALKKVA